MLNIKAMGVGLCAAFLAVPVAMSQTSYSPPTAINTSAMPGPLEFVVRNTSPLLQLPPDRVALQLDYARSKGFVQYSLGHDSALRNTLVERVSQTYGMPLINAYGQFEWRVQNPDPNSSHARIITIHIGEKIQAGYFIKADGRLGRQIINETVPQKQTPLTSGYRGQPVPQIRGPQAVPLGDKP